MRSFFFKYRGMFFIPLAILILFFGKPTMISFLIGIFIAILGELIRIWGVGYAGVTTRKDNVTAPFLVTAGPFAFVRNPLYVGNTITGLGFTVIACGQTHLFVTTIFFVLWAIFYFVVYGIIIPHEETFLKETFGVPYKEYCEYVPRLIPNFKPYPKAQGHFDPKAIMAAESRTLIQFVIFALIMFFKLPQGLLDGKLFFS